MGKSRRNGFSSNETQPQTWYRRGACCQSFLPIIRFDPVSPPPAAAPPVVWVLCECVAHRLGGFLTKLPRSERIWTLWSPGSAVFDRMPKTGLRRSPKWLEEVVIDDRANASHMGGVNVRVAQPLAEHRPAWVVDPLSFSPVIDQGVRAWLFEGAAAASSPRWASASRLRQSWRAGDRFFVCLPRFGACSTWNGRTRPLMRLTRKPAGDTISRGSFFFFFFLLF